MQLKTQNSKLLRVVMRSNGALSTLTGLECLFFAKGTAAFMGLGAEWTAPMQALGISLLFFAAFLFLSSSRWTEHKPAALLTCGAIATLLDLLWVVGSVSLLVLKSLPLSVPGQWLVAVVAVFVFDFAVFQSLGIRRLLRANDRQLAVANG